jgi:sugar phosphate isomerase/epimerase
MEIALITRRQMLAAAGAASALSGFAPAFAQAPEKQLRNMGGAPAGFPARSATSRGGMGRGPAPGGGAPPAGVTPPAPGAVAGGGRGSGGGGGRPFDSLIDHFHSLGFGVAEVSRPASNDPDAIKAFRTRMEQYNMRIIMDVGYPRDENGLANFEAGVKIAKDYGAISLHAAMTQRRYEEFNDSATFKASFERNQKSIAMAEPILAKYQMRLGLENHKGWRSAEQAAWLKRLGSPWVGVHFDFGNNVSLCEDPNDTLKNLLPYTFACHIKDMAVQPYQDGFLLSEVPLGQGFLDIKGMVDTLQKKDPNMPFDLEMITREPLKIPVFTDKYWVTFDDSYSPLPGRDMAHTLDIVRKNTPKVPPPHTAGLSQADLLKLEDACVDESIAWARKNLNL